MGIAKITKAIIGILLAIALVWAAITLGEDATKKLQGYVQYLQENRK